MKVRPFHSKKNSGVYHICTKCAVGKKIARENKALGTGEGTLCQRCEKLTREGGC